MLKLRVYVAGPITRGDQAANVKKAITAADMLAENDFYPFIPHVTFLWHMVYPRDYEYWMQYDAEWLKVCHALFRVPGYSPGADREVELAHNMKMRIFHDLHDIVEWRGRLKAPPEFNING